MCNRVGGWHHPGDRHHTEVEDAGHAVGLAMVIGRRTGHHRTPEDVGPEAPPTSVGRDLHRYGPNLDA